MQKLSPAGEQAIDELAQRHGFTREAVISLFESVVRGHGTMAQFDHPEFGGSGQWMAGGMTMVSDMSNYLLKSRIANLASELARWVESDAALARAVQERRREESDAATDGHGHGTDGHGQHESGPAGRVSLFVPPAPGASHDWWPAALGSPTSAGAQNGVRYAYFARARRLAIEIGGRLTLYDTLDHKIGGFSQQQARGGTLSFQSQHGLIDVADLPIVSVDEASQHAPANTPAEQQPSTSSKATGGTSDALAAIEKLAELHAKGILNDEEFSAKKAELLRRI
jgi:hypothetical protein